MNDIGIFVPPGTFPPGFRAFKVPSPDESGVNLEIEIIVSAPGNYLILGCQHVAPWPIDDKLPCLVKYSDVGMLDPGFGVDGYAVIDLVQDAKTKGMGRLLNVVALSDGGYLARLDATVEVEIEGVKHERFCVALARFTKDGKKDAAFGMDGIATFPLEPPPDVAVSKSGTDGEHERSPRATIERAPKNSDFPDLVLGDMKLLPDGKVLVYASAVNSEKTHRTYVLRILENGDLDFTLNGSGIVELIVEGAWFRPFRIAGQTSDGKFVVSGERPGVSFVGRFNGDGTLDKNYGTDGDFIDRGEEYGDAAWHQLLQLRDGSLICVGHAGSRAAVPGSTGVVAVAKIDGEGHRVVGFNGGHTVYMSPNSPTGGFSLWSFGALIDDAERVVIAGKQLDEGMIITSFIARLLKDGSKDPHLDAGGITYHKPPDCFNTITEHLEGKGYYATGYIFKADGSGGDQLYRLTSKSPPT